jgi:hypothetical protein
LGNVWLGPYHTAEAACGCDAHGAGGVVNKPSYNQPTNWTFGPYTVTLWDINEGTPGGLLYYVSWVLGSTGPANYEPYGLTGGIVLQNSQDRMDIVVSGLTSGTLYSLDVVQTIANESDYLIDVNSSAYVITDRGDNKINIRAVNNQIHFQLTALYPSVSPDCLQNSAHILIAGFMLTPLPPPTPTGLTAVGGNGQVTLSWRASPGATSYHVKRRAWLGRWFPWRWATIASPTTTGYINKNLVSGAKYYYVVSAVNAAGEGANSSKVLGTAK